MTPELRSRILEIYETVDRMVAEAGPRCEASGRCCHFKDYGHTLFVSQFEAEILLETAPPYSKPVTPDGCPFQQGTQCTARTERPLGCRIYFCDPSYQDRQGEITEHALHQLKRLAGEFHTGWRYAPLYFYLNEAERPQDRFDPPESPDDRISLPLR